MRTVLAEGHETINPLLPATPDLVWGAVCFLVLAFLFTRYVLPRMNTMLDERSAKIEGGIKKAEAAQAEAAAALAKYNEQLSDARAEAGRIREAARADGVKILNDLKAQAQTEAARITANASTQIEAERQSALVSLRSEVGSLAIDLASGVIRESLTDDARSAALVDRFLADLEATDTADADQARTARPAAVAFSSDDSASR